MTEAPEPTPPFDGDEPMNLRSMVARGDRFAKGDAVYRFDDRRGRAWIFTPVDPTTFHPLPDGEPLEVADPDSGLPRLPHERDIVGLLRKRVLRRLSDPLASAARRRAREEEASKTTVIARDPVAQLRWDVCLWFDAAPRSNDPYRLTQDLESAFDRATIVERYGFFPSAHTALSWARRRGRKGDRRWCDMEDGQGQGPRRKRVVGERFEIALWHATRAMSRPGARLSPSVAHRGLLRDMNRLAAGKPLKADKFALVRDIPPERIPPMDRTTFYKLCSAIDTAGTERTRLGSEAVRQRREGGGRSAEPTRFMSVVQCDETEIGGFFFIDPIRRVPLGTAVSTIAVCVHSTAIVGWDLSWQPASTASWMRVVRHMASIKEVPPEFAKDFPDLELLCGIASSMVYDNASHYAGLAVQDAGGDLVTDVILAGEGVPTHKGLVERKHRAIFENLHRRLPSRKFPAGLAREWNIDLSTRTAISLNDYRKHFAAAVADLNALGRDDVTGRTPLQIARADRRRFSIMMPSDVEAFDRAIAAVDYTRVFRGTGVVVDGLQYSHPDGNSGLLDNFVQASADRRRTKNPAFNAKIKVYDDDLSRVAIFNPLTRRYVDLLCTKRIYSVGLTREMHQIVKAAFWEQSVEDLPEEKLLEIRGQVEDALENAHPDQLARDDRAHMRALADPRTLAIAADRVETKIVAPSPTGLDVVHRADGVSTRADATQRPPRPPRAEHGSELEEPTSSGAGKATRGRRPATAAKRGRPENTESSGSAAGPGAGAGADDEITHAAAPPPPRTESLPAAETSPTTKVPSNVADAGAATEGTAAGDDATRRQEVADAGSSNTRPVSPYSKFRF